MNKGKKFDSLLLILVYVGRNKLDKCDLFIKGDFNRRKPQYFSLMKEEVSEFTEEITDRIEKYKLKLRIRNKPRFFWFVFSSMEKMNKCNLKSKQHS